MKESILSEDEFYELLSKQMNETEDKLSALDKILKAFEAKKKMPARFTDDLLTDNNLKTKNNENKTEE